MNLYGFDFFVENGTMNCHWIHILFLDGFMAFYSLFVYNVKMEKDFIRKKG